MKAWLIEFWENISLAWYYYRYETIDPHEKNWHRYLGKCHLSDAIGMLKPRFLNKKVNYPDDLPF